MKKTHQTEQRSRCVTEFKRQPLFGLLMSVRTNYTFFGYLRETRFRFRHPPDTFKGNSCDYRNTRGSSYWRESKANSNTPHKARLASKARADQYP